MKKLLSLILCLVLVLSFATGCSGAAEKSEATPAEPAEIEETAGAEEAAESITLKLGHKAPVENDLHLIATKFKELVEDRTDGRVKIEIYPQGQLGNDRDLIEAMQFGTVDMAVNITAVYSNFEPLFGALDLPYLFADWDHMLKFVESDVADELLSKLEDDGIIGLSLKANGFRNVTNNVRPIQTPDDLKGIKMRVLESPVFVKTFEDLGAVVSAMSWGEVYTALQQGAIDGQETPPEVIYTEKVTEVQKYMSKTEHITSFSALGISKITWDKLSADDQKVIKESAVEAAKYMTAQAREKEADFIKKIEDAGVAVNDVDKSLFIEKTTSAYDWFESEYDISIANEIKAMK